MGCTIPFMMNEITTKHNIARRDFFMFFFKESKTKIYFERLPVIYIKSKTVSGLKKIIKKKKEEEKR